TAMAIISRATPSNRTPISSRYSIVPPLIKRIAQNQAVFHHQRTLGKHKVRSYGGGFDDTEDIE
ncbi:hypothetical protein K8R78_05275, partial [bacterium]|nr:hypothetical protein [bacterium]